ncbi:MAG: M48 family metalloprotease [Magnetococcales bacterium]|nr:M48 family metalloprotease [Magnetococcales bacterium]
MPVRTNIGHPPPSRLFFLVVALLLRVGMVQAENAPIVLASGLETTELLRMIGEPLAQAAELPPKEVQFHVVLNGTLNAFALPNQHIVFHSGLLLAVRNRDELAGVMAHEIAHLMAGHHIQIDSLAKKMSVQSMIAAAAGILAGVASNNGQLGQAVIAGGMASAQTSMLEAVRRRESQSDTLAVSLLARTGFNPEGLAGFMNRLAQQQHLTSLPPPYLLTHPVSTERLMDARRLAEEHPSTVPRRPDQAENRLLARAQAMLEAETSDSPDQIANQLRNRLRLDPGNLALSAGLAEALRSAGRLPEAESQLNALLKGREKDVYLLRQRGMVRTEMGKYTEAEADFRAGLVLLPDNEELRYRQAFALKELKKTPEASRILRQLTAQHPQDPQYVYLLGLVEGQGGHEGEGHLAMGRYFTLIQEKKNAQWHFQEAIRLLPANSPEQSIARNELAQTQKMETPPKKGEKRRRGN